MQTRASLLLRIRDPQDGLAWREFVELYAPLLHAYGRRHGLQDADAADLAQDTLSNVLQAAPEFVYDPSRGAFRGWLFTIARNQIRKFANRQARFAPATGGSDVRAVIEAQPDRGADADAWDREYQMNLFNWAAKRVRPEFRANTWDAFWRTVVLQEETDAVARALGMTPGAVYIARSRVTARIRQEVATVEGDAP